MFFKKKTSKCENCNSKINDKYSFCPHCGISLLNEEKYVKDYGLLGKNEKIEDEEFLPQQFGMGITDKLLGSLMNTLIKSLDKQFKQMGKEFKMDKTEIKSFPNGIKIKIGPASSFKKTPQKKAIFNKQISDEQLEKMAALPRAKAETKVKRLNDKIIYELSTPGIQSPDDVFVSKLESGYEIKVISDKKVYVNSLPVNLPLKSLSIDNNKLLIEFLSYMQ